MKKNHIFTILSALFLAAVLVLASCETYEGEEEGFVAVTDITDIPTTWTVLIPLPLTGTVKPDNATYQTIIWTVEGTNPTLTPPGNNSLTATSPVKVKGAAIIPNGMAKGKEYKKSFEITFSEKFVAVTGITGISSTGTVGIPISLDVPVNPVDATDKKIIWTITGNGADAVINENDNTLSAKKAGVVLLRAAIANGKGVDDPFSTVFSITFSYTAVTGIKDVPKSGFINTDIKLKDLTVEPANATNKDITWKVINSGNTGAEIKDGILTSAKEGTVTVEATVANGLAIGTPFTKDYDIVISDRITNYVTDITGIPRTAPRGRYTLNGTVVPSNASIKTIAWTVVPPNTWANFSGSTLNTTRTGTITVLATITNGLGTGKDYTKPFDIEIISEAENIAEKLGGNAWVNENEEMLILPSGTYNVNEVITVKDLDVIVRGKDVTLNIENGSFTVNEKFVISDGCTLTVTGGGTLNLIGDSAVNRSCKLDVQDMTVNIYNKLDVQGELKIATGSKVSVENNGKLTISNGPDHEGVGGNYCQNNCDWDFRTDNKGKISGNGIVEVQKGGTMRMPNPASDDKTFNLKGITTGSKIVIKKGGDFHLLGVLITQSDGDRFFHVEWPLISSVDRTTYSPPEIKWIGVEYIVTDGLIEITTVDNKGIPEFTLKGEANALGVRTYDPPSPFTALHTRAPIELQHKFTIDARSVLTIGSTSPTVAPSTYPPSIYRVKKHADPSGSIAGGYYTFEVTPGTLINNGIIKINNNSVLELELDEIGKEDAIKGTSTIINSAGDTITPTYVEGSPNIKKWAGRDTTLKP
jgi:hypothetical protein